MNRGGFALVFVLLVVAAVELLTIASIALATHEAVIADARVRTATAQRNAEAALKHIARAWNASGIPPIAIGQTIFPAGANPVEISIQRTAWGLYHARARASSGRASIERAAMLRTLDLHRAMHESNEAIVSAGPLLLARTALSTDDEERCPLPYVPEMPAANVTVPNRHFALGISNARIDSAHSVLPAGYAAAGIQWDEIASIADVQASAVLHLVETDSAGARIFPLIYAPSDLQIASGSGQGLLFVNGSLTIEENVRFDGLVIVRGVVHIKDGVQIRGVLRVHSTRPSTIGAATITYSRCSCVRSLLESPASTRLIKAHRFYIPAF